MCRAGQPLSALVAARMARYPCSGEINRNLLDPDAALQRVEARYQAEAIAVDRTDGLSLEFPTWRFNLRPSNTEPVLRLNVETRQDPALLQGQDRRTPGPDDLSRYAVGAGLKPAPTRTEESVRKVFSGPENGFPRH